MAGRSSPTIAIAYGVLVALAAFALLRNLGDRLLWGDEAETALLALNVTKYGVPRADDGKNHVTLLGAGVDSNESGIWIWSPWLDEYLVAGSFLAFGPGTTSARLPFALVGVLAVAAMGFAVYRMHSSHEIALFSVALLATNVPFLLHARQSRYYAVVFLAQIVLLYGHHLLFSEERRRGTVLLSAALVVQFYCNYVLVLGNVAALGIVALLALRREAKLFLAQLAAFAVLLVAAMPWVLYAKPWRQSRHSGAEDFFTNIAYYVGEIHFHVLPLVLVVLVLVFLPRWRAHRSPSEALLWLLPACHLFILAMAPEIRYFRYIYVLLPGLILLEARILATLVRPRSLRIAILLVLCLSNGLSMLTGFPWRGDHYLDAPFPAFLREITTEYEDRLEDVVAFFDENASSDDSLFGDDPEFPLIFYTGMRVIDGRLHDLDPADPPTWILPESASGVTRSRPLRIPESLASRYERVDLSVRNSPRQGCRPAPDAHSAFSNPNRTRFTLLRLVDPGDGAPR